MSEKGSMREEEFTMAHTLTYYNPSRWTIKVGRVNGRRVRQLVTVHS